MSTSTTTQAEEQNEALLFCGALLSMLQRETQLEQQQTNTKFCIIQKTNTKIERLFHLIRGAFSTNSITTMDYHTAIPVHH